VNPFHAGELTLLVDRNGKHYLTRLSQDGEFVFHQGVVRHADVIGKEEGVLVRTSRGGLVWAYRPRMQDYLVEAPRQSTIMYPKDIAFLLMWADVFPGARVFEAGVGTGALSTALLRAIGADGQLVSYEIRADMIEHARRTVEGFHGACANWTVRQRDVYDGIDDGPFDRVVLDLSQPWRVLEHAARAMVPGGLICSYVPNVTQVAESVQAYRSVGLFAEIETYECSFRAWEFKAPVARPLHAMIGHTGFLTFARRGQPRDSTSNADAEGTPEAL
jgi:tRNA (adenine57-N1/adenine58-N1)-methyltransferase catalytic subunit